MLIEIKEDVVERAQKNCDLAIYELEQLAKAYQKGHHYIFVNHKIIVEICKLNGLSNYSKSVYNRMRDKLNDLSAISKFVKLKVILSFKDPQCQYSIWFNPETDKDLDLSIKTQLVFEHYNESKFYLQIARNYRRMKKLKCNIKFNPVHGGGNITNEVFQNVGQNHLCLAIVDSDKKYPEGECGTTSKNFQSIEHDKPSTCDYYVLKNVMEIENLIPLGIIKEKLAGREIYKSIDYSYFDMKEGLSFCKVKDAKFVEYWHTQVTKEKNSKPCEYAKKCKNCTQSNKDEETKNNCNEVPNKKIIDGFGSNLLDSILIDSKLLGKLENNDAKDLSYSQKEEWKTLGELILKWCCASEQILV